MTLRSPWSRTGRRHPARANGAPARLALLAVAALAAAVPAAAQQPPAVAPAEDVYSEAISVEVINIDVYVTDGTPVRGLTRDDFQLLVDAKPVPISNFYAVESPVRGAGQGVRSAPDAPISAPPEPAPEAEAPTAETPKDQRLLVVIYIDNYNLTPFKRNKVMVELRQFLRDFLSPEDQVMLATYDRELHLRQPFTARPENVTRALIEIETMSAQGIHMQRERLDYIRRIEDSETVTDAMHEADRWAANVRNDISFTLDSLRSVVDNLAASNGRKALIYVSEGLPMIAGEDMFHVVQQKWQEQTSLNAAIEYDMSRRYRELANQANANRVSFYTIDASGLSTLSQGTVDLDVAGAAGSRTFFDTVYRSNMQSTLQMLAERTGGRAILNTNRFLPDLERVALDFQNYYALGYVNAEADDGRLHRVEVKLTNPQRRLSVRHRDSFRSKSVETRMHDGTLSALHLDLQDNPLEARLEFGLPKPRPDGLYDVPLAIRVPMRNLTLLPAAGNQRGRLRLWFAAKDDKDQISEVQELPAQVEVPTEGLEQHLRGDWEYVLDLLMEPGYHDVAIGLLDQLGAQRVFLRHGLAVGQERVRGR
jgi:VWFA-related protein